MSDYVTVYSNGMGILLAKDVAEVMGYRGGEMLSERDAMTAVAVNCHAMLAEIKAERSRRGPDVDRLSVDPNRKK